MKKIPQSRMVDGVEVAPDCCIVCYKSAKNAKRGDGWTGLGGVVPAGAMVCSTDCLNVAIARAAATGRVDDKKGK